jgi:hypothetical protein
MKWAKLQKISLFAADTPPIPSQEGNKTAGGPLSPPAMERDKWRGTKLRSLPQKNAKSRKVSQRLRILCRCYKEQNKLLAGLLYPLGKVNFACFALGLSLLFRHYG